MINIIINKLHLFLTNELGISPMWADRIKELTAAALLVALALLCSYVVRVVLAPTIRNFCKKSHSNLLALIIKYRALRHFAHAVAGGAVLIALPAVLDFNPMLLHFADLLTQSYIVVTLLLGINALLLILHDLYTTKKGQNGRSLKGFVQICQVALFFVGAIIIIALLLDKSPATLFAGLGASAAVLMLVFKDTILGFVAGIQLSANDMVRIGDWIQMPDGSANGIVKEITLNTVKIQNWDNTISTIPPYTLVTSAFQNWRGMQESGGRRVNKLLYFDMKSVHELSEAEIKDYLQRYAQLNNITLIQDEPISNLQLFRYYIERHLAHHAEINPQLDIIVSEKEPTQYGLPIQVYFFLRNKRWKEYEHIQSDIFDHLLITASNFGLNLYQYAERPAYVPSGR